MIRRRRKSSFKDVKGRRIYDGDLIVIINHMRKISVPCRVSYDKYYGAWIVCPDDFRSIDAIAFYSGDKNAVFVVNQLLSTYAHRGGLYEIQIIKHDKEE